MLLKRYDQVVETRHKIFMQQRIMFYKVDQRRNIDVVVKQMKILLARSREQSSFHYLV